MVLRVTDLPQTAAVTSRLEVVARTGSTNADLAAAVRADPAAWPHLSVLLTDDQTAGRGRLDRVWTAPAGTALAVSVVLDVTSLPPVARGWIPLMAGAAWARAVAAQLPLHTVRVKWPNDVLVDGRKICGVLAEFADADRIVLGAGVNTAMSADQLPVPTAVSFAALGATVDADLLLRDALRALDEQIAALTAADGDAAVSGVHAEIEALCGTIGTAVRVHLPGGAQLVGTAVGLGATGALRVDTGAETVEVTAGDVVHVR